MNRADRHWPGLRSVGCARRPSLRSATRHGATVMRQALPLDLDDQIRVHVIPVLLGAGTPLFGALASPVTLERTQALITPAATHIGFRVIR
jgi:hypothetical protein